MEALKWACVLPHVQMAIGKIISKFVNDFQVSIGFLQFLISQDLKYVSYDFSKLPQATDEWTI